MVDPLGFLGSETRFPPTSPTLLSAQSLSWRGHPADYFVECRDECPRGPAHENKAELPSHPLERAKDHRKDLHSEHLCPGLGGSEQRRGGEKKRQVRGGGRHGGKEWGRGKRRGGGARAPLTCLRVHTSNSDSPGVPGVTGEGDPTVLLSPDRLTMDNYCETHHSNPDAAEQAEGSHDVEHVALQSLAVVVAL